MTTDDLRYIDVNDIHAAFFDHAEMNGSTEEEASGFADDLLEFLMAHSDEYRVGDDMLLVDLADVHHILTAWFKDNKCFPAEGYGRIMSSVLREA